MISKAEKRNRHQQCNKLGGQRTSDLFISIVQGYKSLKNLAFVILEGEVGLLELWKEAKNFPKARARD
jgi:hypothetical protein